MALATIAYRVSSDPSFAFLLQQSPDVVLQSAGIILTGEERGALQKILSVPGMIDDLLNRVLKSEPWVYCA
jgi:argonaute-like protein implicated in RNA metabolism and viral defense